MKIFIAIPAYDNRVHTRCMSAVVANISFLEKAGHEVGLYFENGKCYLPEARSLCVRMFLKTNCDCMVFVDTDLWFEEDAIYKLTSNLTNARLDVVFGAYPFKVGDEGFPVSINVNDDQTPVVDHATGLISATMGATGLMAISKGILERLIDKNPDWNVKRSDGSTLSMVFDTGRVVGDDRWIGEDVMFCMRVRDSGGSICCYPDIDFVHMGDNGRAGNYHKFLLSQPQPEEASA